MIILEDSRQQDGKHRNVHAFCKANGIRIIRTKLLVGDYTFPADQRICVDTKFGMSEVYSDLVSDHDRFHREYALAQECGIKLVFLVEDKRIQTLDDVADWKNPLYAKWWDGEIGRKPRSSASLAKQMETVAKRYGCEWHFCDPHETGLAVVNILTGGE